VKIQNQNEDWNDKQKIQSGGVKKYPRKKIGDLNSFQHFFNLKVRRLDEHKKGER